MSEKNGVVELYRKHRPTLWKQVLGQDEAVQTLDQKIKKGKFPHALLLSGQTGSGKTTLAYIVQKKMGCGEEDFVEINAADFRGLDTVRDIRQRMGSAPMFGKCRMWLFEEVHRWPDATQSVLLRMLEDPPAHVYFILCTDQPDKLLKTIQGRCMQVRLSPLSNKVIGQLVTDVAAKEKVEVSDDVVNKIAEVSEGSGRRALQLLDQVLEFDDEETRLDTIRKADTEKQAIELARMLMRDTKWPEIAAFLQKVEEDHESLRYMVLGYAAKVLLSGKGSNRAHLIITAFESSFRDSGVAGLVRACAEVCPPK